MHQCRSVTTPGERHGSRACLARHSSLGSANGSSTGGDHAHHCPMASGDHRGPQPLHTAGTGWRRAGGQRSHRLRATAFARAQQCQPSPQTLDSAMVGLARNAHLGRLQQCGQAFLDAPRGQHGLAMRLPGLRLTEATLECLANVGDALRQYPRARAGQAGPGGSAAVGRPPPDPSASRSWAQSVAAASANSRCSNSRQRGAPSPHDVRLADPAALA